MAARVRNTDVVVFGIMVAAQAVTHVRFQLDGSDPDPVVVELDATVNVAIGERLRIPALSMAVKYNSGDLTDAHMSQIIRDYWDGNAFEIDAMTDDSTVVADTGYAQQTTSDWTFDTPADT